MEIKLGDRVRYPSVSSVGDGTVTTVKPDYVRVTWDRWCEPGEECSVNYHLNYYDIGEFILLSRKNKPTVIISS